MIVKPILRKLLNCNAPNNFFICDNFKYYTFLLNYEFEIVSHTLIYMVYINIYWYSKMTVSSLKTEYNGYSSVCEFGRKNSTSNVFVESMPSQRILEYKDYFNKYYCSPKIVTSAYKFTTLVWRLLWNRDIFNVLLNI